VNVLSRVPQISSLVALAFVGACSSGGGAPAAAGTAPAPAATVRRPRQDQQLITREVITGTQYTNMFDVIQAMRSNWLMVKSGTAGEGKQSVLQVYLDNQRIGGVDELRRILPSTVQSARFYDAIAASARWGMDHGAGAIFIVTAK
jgi:hypothetical protein